MKKISEFIEKELFIKPERKSIEENIKIGDFNIISNIKTYKLTDYCKEETIKTCVIHDDTRQTTIYSNNSSFQLIKEEADYKNNIIKNLTCIKVRIKDGIKSILEYNKILLFKNNEYFVIKSKYSDSENFTLSQFYFEDFGNKKVFTDEYDKVKPRYEIMILYNREIFEININNNHLHEHIQFASRYSNENDDILYHYKKTIINIKNSKMYKYDIDHKVTSSTELMILNNIEEDISKICNHFSALLSEDNPNIYFCKLQKECDYYEFKHCNEVCKIIVNDNEYNFVDILNENNESYYILNTETTAKLLSYCKGLK